MNKVNYSKKKGVPTFSGAMREIQKNGHRCWKARHGKGLNHSSGQEGGRRTAAPHGRGKPGAKKKGVAGRDAGGCVGGTRCKRSKKKHEESTCRLKKVRRRWKEPKKKQGRGGPVKGFRFWTATKGRKNPTSADKELVRRVGVFLGKKKEPP